MVKIYFSDNNKLSFSLLPGNNKLVIIFSGRLKKATFTITDTAHELVKNQLKDLLIQQFDTYD